jgi:hypothetical protein
MLVIATIDRQDRFCVNIALLVVFGRERKRSEGLQCQSAEMRIDCSTAATAPEGGSNNGSVVPCDSNPLTGGRAGFVVFCLFLVLAFSVFLCGLTIVVI